MTNTSPEAIATVRLPRNPDHRASSAAWTEHARILGEIIGRARPMTEVFADNKPRLVVARRSWPRHADRAMGCAAALERGDVDRFLELMGVPESVELSEDARAIDRTSWCRCDDVDGEEWVYVEVWGSRGMLSHGYVHRGCRRWLQTG